MRGDNRVDKGDAEQVVDTVTDQAQSHSTKNGADRDRVHWQPQARQGQVQGPSREQAKAFYKVDLASLWQKN